MLLHFNETKQKGFHMELDLQLSVEAMDHVLKFDDQLGNDILDLPKGHVFVCKTVAWAGLVENYHLSIGLHEVHL